jgi:hypothetical protein
MAAEQDIGGEQSVDFSGLILGFCSAALSYMGVDTSGGAGREDKNLVLAKQNIDIIELLRQKTQGNLTESESHLIQQVLTDLRMRYVGCTKSP